MKVYHLTQVNTTSHNIKYLYQLSSYDGPAMGLSCHDDVRYLTSR